MYGTMEAWLLFSCVAALCEAMWAIFDRKKKKKMDRLLIHTALDALILTLHMRLLIDKPGTGISPSQS